ncbi:MAG: hypothetical protein H8E31_01315 [Planctomycetes bacterium]|nr:hypothetical protein [Planctomycetota bacterium]
MKVLTSAAVAGVLGLACSAGILDPDATRPISVSPASPIETPEMQYATFAAG